VVRTWISRKPRIRTFERDIRGGGVVGHAVHGRVSARLCPTIPCDLVGGPNPPRSIRAVGKSHRRGCKAHPAATNYKRRRRGPT